MLDLEIFKQFLNAEISIEEKELFITSSADDVYIPSTGMSPLEWFQSITTRIEEKLSGK